MNKSNGAAISCDDKLEYNPGRLLDTIIQNLGLKNDAQLCRVLEVPAPVISKIRGGKLSVGASMLLRMHDATGLSIRDLRYLIGDPRTGVSVSGQLCKQQP